MAYDVISIINGLPVLLLIFVLISQCDCRIVKNLASPFDRLCGLLSRCNIKARSLPFETFWFFDKIIRAISILILLVCIDCLTDFYWFHSPACRSLSLLYRMVVGLVEQYTIDIFQDFSVMSRRLDTLQEEWISEMFYVSYRSVSSHCPEHTTRVLL